MLFRKIISAVFASVENTVYRKEEEKRTRNLLKLNEIKKICLKQTEFRLCGIEFMNFTK